MTEDEYLNQLQEEGIILTGDELLNTTIQRNKKYYQQKYINIIKEAKENKKEIPYNVLAQFPYMIRPDLSDDEIDEMIDHTFQLETNNKVLTWMYWTPKKDRKHNHKPITNWL